VLFIGNWAIRKRGDMYGILWDSVLVPVLRWI